MREEETYTPTRGTLEDLGSECNNSTNFLVISMVRYLQEREVVINRKIMVALSPPLDCSMKY